MSKVHVVMANREPLKGPFRSVRSYIRTAQDALDRRDGLSHSAQLLAFVLIAAAVFSRCPSDLTRAQFFAEDGSIWYAQAYDFGWARSLLIPYAGYLQILPRLGAGLAILVPLRDAPLVMAIIGTLLQVLPAMILLSERCRTWAPLSTRVLFATAYIALPNAGEVHIVLTNAQWHLALAAVLLAFAAPPKGWPGRFFDCSLFVIGGFSGPFFIVLAPLLLGYWWFRRQGWTLVILAIASIGASTQLLVLIHGPARIHQELGVRLETFLRIIGGHIVAGAMFGSRHDYALRSPMFVIVAAAFCCFAICLYCLRWTNLELKLFILYCAALFAASLRSPYGVGGARPAWDMLLWAMGVRYWFLPMLAFVWSSIWCARNANNRLLKYPFTVIVVLMIAGIVTDWRYPALPGMHFPDYARQFQDARPGTHVAIPIVPDGWQMELVRRVDSR